jgi:sodium-dependent dicarboxylate transporter 2/3/5
MNWETALKLPWGILLLFGGGLSLAAVAPGLGLDPLQLIVTGALAASCAFMMPVATPPNAVVFGSNRITMAQMRNAGLWLNLTAIALITVGGYLVFVPVLG